MEFLNWAWSCNCSPRIQEVEKLQSVKAAKRKGGKEGRRGGGGEKGRARWEIYREGKEKEKRQEERKRNDV